MPGRSRRERSSPVRPRSGRILGISSDVKTVLYTDPFVPAEWIAAHGMRPRRILPKTAAQDRFLRMGLCPYARAFMNAVAGDDTGDIVVFATTCDQMRRGSELVSRTCDRPVFLMNVPATWRTDTARALYRAELERLGSFLVRLGGTRPSRADAAETFAAYDAGRASLRATRSCLSPRQFAEAAASFCQPGALPNRIGSGDAARRRHPQGVRLALVGGPLMADGFDVFDIAEQAGGVIVLDATGTGERTLPGPLDQSKLHKDPLGSLVQAYFDTIPDAFRRPNTALYVWLKRHIEERGVAGVIVRYYTWCDLWHAEASPMEEVLARPTLTVDVADGDDAACRLRTRTRIQAFVESLR